MACDNNEKYAKLDAVIEEMKGEKGALMPTLQKAQDIFGYVPIDVQERIADGLGVTLSDIYGVATFYSQFSLEEKGKHTISVCMGTACYVKGAQEILDRLSEELSVPAGKTTNDGKFALEATRCLGCCGLAPVITIDEDVYGRLAPEDIKDILAKY